MIAGMNVTSLLLAKGTARQREIAMRGALGASTCRVMQQLVIEGLLLSGVAGLLGISLALAAVRIVRSAVPSHSNLDFSYQIKYHYSWSTLRHHVAIWSAFISLACIFGSTGADRALLATEQPANRPEPTTESCP